jgi:hypothetical protein
MGSSINSIVLMVKTTKTLISMIKSEYCLILKPLKQNACSFTLSFYPEFDVKLDLYSQ